MKRLIFFLLVSFVGCSQYKPVLKPLRFVEANCKCRYEKIARDWYDKQLAEHLSRGRDIELAKTLARAETDYHIGEIQKRVARGLDIHCDCNNPARFAKNQ